MSKEEEEVVKELTKIVRENTKKIIRSLRIIKILSKDYEKNQEVINKKIKEKGDKNDKV